MGYFVLLLQGIVSVSILNVWLFQSKKPTRWRGGNASTIIEEFRVYGLPPWVFFVVGFLKVGLALGLLVAFWYRPFRRPAALGLAVLLLGSIFMHLKVKDPLIKSLPAGLFLVMCLVIALF